MSPQCERHKSTPLYDKHLAAGARMVPFSGWEMPVQYTGIIEEHMWTRRSASIFDVSHMGEFFLKGKGAAGAVEKLVTCRASSLKPGRARYGFLLNEKGGIVDDLIVFRLSDEEFMLVVNAGTLEKDRRWIEARSGGCAFFDASDATAKIDIQGPLSEKALLSVPSFRDVRGLKRFGFTALDWKGARIIVSATGYTGEAGYEIFLPAEKAGEVWDALLGVDGVRPAGLGARDSLRLEAGYPLYGHDIDEGHTPLEAGFERFVDTGKDFYGREALEKQKAMGFRLVLSGFICEGRRSARGSFTVTSGGKERGKVTSGVFSPCLKRGIGLCYIDKELSAEGTGVVLTDGRIEIKSEIKKPPFVRLGLDKK